MKDWPTHDYPGGNPMLHAKRSSREAFGFSRRQWLLGWVEYHVRHLLWRLRRV